MTEENRNLTAAAQRWAEVKSRIATYRREPLAVIKADAAAAVSEAWSRFLKLGFMSKLWVVWVAFVVSYCLLLLVGRGVFDLGNWVESLFLVGGLAIFPRWYSVRHLSSRGAGLHILSRLWVVWVVFVVNNGLFFVILGDGVFALASWVFFLGFVGVLVVLPRLFYFWLFPRKLWTRKS